MLQSVRETGESRAKHEHVRVAVGEHLEVGEGVERDCGAREEPISMLDHPPLNRGLRLESGPIHRSRDALKPKHA